MATVGETPPEDLSSQGTQVSDAAVQETDVATQETDVATQETTDAAIQETAVVAQDGMDNGQDPVIESQEGFVIPGSYCIEKGDTLAKISRKFYGDESMIDKICEVNGIQDKNSIQYGVNIVLP